MGTEELVYVGGLLRMGGDSLLMPMCGSVEGGFTGKVGCLGLMGVVGVLCIGAVKVDCAGVVDILVLGGVLQYNGFFCHSFPICERP